MRAPGSWIPRRSALGIGVPTPHRVTRCLTMHRMEIFDHIVIGAGSAGCAVAARLSQDATTRVLLIEAGGSDRRLETRAPAAFAQMFHTRMDWDYYTEPE